MAGFWRNVRDYLLVGHGLMVMGYWWTAMEVSGNRWKQGVEFRISEEKKKGTSVTSRLPEAGPAYIWLLSRT